ncbi:MAG: hypothetical protein SNJ54_04885, partial [Anaerolineae bacterium]
MTNQVTKRFRLLIVVAVTAVVTVLGLPAGSVMAQVAPTATPTDPTWLGFVAARNAVQARERV